MPRSWQRGNPWMIWTDFKSPAAETDKGQILAQNANSLMAMQCTFNEMPLQHIDIMNPPPKLIDEVPRHN